MWNSLNLCSRLRPLRLWACFAINLGFTALVCSQTASTGALTGIILDPSGAGVPGVTAQLAKDDGSEVKYATSDEQGRFAFLFLPPGR